MRCLESDSVGVKDDSHGNESVSKYGLCDSEIGVGRGVDIVEFNCCRQVTDVGTAKQEWQLCVPILTTLDQFPKANITVWFGTG